MSLVEALARDAKPPVFCLVGDGGRDRARALRADDRLRVIDSPRHATVLVVVGELPTVLQKAARRVHDQLSRPRCVALCSGRAEQPPFASALYIADGEDLGAKVVELHRQLVCGERDSTPSLGRPQSPVEWQGVGPYGQGGEGMMGGVPYGRAMAMTGEDLRDGLQLDRVSVSVGPFLSWLPPGLRLSVELQGDVIQKLTPRVPPLRCRDLPEVFVTALGEEVRVADLELARARHHLGATADLLLVVGLEPLAARAVRLAANLTPDSVTQVKAMARSLRRSGALDLSTRRVGCLPAEHLVVGGPVARAAGRKEDARQRDPAYRDLGFESLCLDAGDAHARFCQRLAEAVQALELAKRAGDRRRSPGQALEGPRGPVGRDAAEDWLSLVCKVAVGQGWDSFVTTLVSLDLDVAGLPRHVPFDPDDEDDQQGEEGQDESGTEDHEDVAA